jgi:hypothetical protein
MAQKPNAINSKRAGARTTGKGRKEAMVTEVGNQTWARRRKTGRIWKAETRGLGGKTQLTSTEPGKRSNTQNWIFAEDDGCKQEEESSRAARVGCKTKLKILPGIT